MSDLRRRVSALERRLGKVSDSGWCECKRALRVVVVWPESESERESEPVPEVCERCGRPVRVTRLVVQYGDDEVMDDE